VALAMTDDQHQLADSVRRVLERDDTLRTGRAQLDAPREELPSFWTDAGELGWLGVHLSAEHGGIGLGLDELAVVVYELGRVVAPGPFLPTVLASAVLAQHSDDPEVARLLPRLADGSMVAAVGWDAKIRQTTASTLDGEGGQFLAPVSLTCCCWRSAPISPSSTPTPPASGSAKGNSSIPPGAVPW
jgi:3-oxochol-4-en-24-oyl-CoA dehydrogenase